MPAFCYPVGTLSPKISLIPTNGLIVYYPFNGNANDESGNGYNATVDGAILTTNRHSQSNKAYSFDGINDKITKSFETTFRQSVFSISFWVKSDRNNSSATNQWCVDCWETGVTNALFGAYIETYATNGDRDISFIYNYGAATARVLASIKMPNTGQWYHIVCIHGATSDKLYIDGVEDTGITYTLGSFNAGIDGTDNPNLYIGARSNDSEYFEGGLDDILMYDRELTDEEVLILYNQ